VCFRSFCDMFLSPFLSIIQIVFLSGKSGMGAAGHTAEVKELLNKHGADKLSEIDPSEYPALLADAEVL